MNVQRIERISDFMRHAGRQQCERLDALAFNGLEGFLPRLGGIVQNERDAGTAGGFAIERRGVKTQKARTRVIHLKFVPGDVPAALAVKAREFFPVEFGQKTRDVLAFDSRLQAQQARDRLVEVKDPALLIHDEHAIFNGVEQRLKKTAFPCQPLDHRLQTLGVQPSDAAKHFVEKTGFGPSH